MYETVTAQQVDTFRHMTDVPVQLDSIVVKAGFDPRAFIRRVQTDTTFYKAFKSLHLKPFTAKNNFTAYEKDGTVAATNKSTITQVISGTCRADKVTDEQTTGKFYKRNGARNYYTAELFYDLFYSKTPVCNESDIVAGTMRPAGTSRMEKNKYELKQLIFNPGSKVNGVPFMGDRASIFDADEIPKYNFRIGQEVYNGVDCLVFSIVPKPEYRTKVVYNELITWFRKADYSILARDYALSFNTLFYDFDVKMKVRTREIDGKLYPTHIEYDGNWHVVTQKTERTKVVADITY